MCFLGGLEPGANEVDFLRRGADTLARLFLECVQDIDTLGKANGVNGAVRVAVMVVHNLQDACAAKAGEGLGAAMFAALDNTIVLLGTMPYPNLKAEV